MFEPHKRSDAYRALCKADREVVDNIVKHGDDLSQPRETTLYFYHHASGDRASFDRIAAAAPERQLSVSRMDADSLILEGHLHVHPEALKALIDWAVEQATQANAEFDGWECAIVATKH